MKQLTLLFVALFVTFGATLTTAAQPATDFVDLNKFDYSIRLDLRYATNNNFTHHVLYPEARCLLRKPVAEALSRVEESLKMEGLGLKVFDCYRPLSIQKKLWALVPDDRYVADPSHGSKHNRGAAVDLTLVDRTGDELAMPSGFDDFTEKAHRDYKGASRVAIRNRSLLEKAMQREGFIGIPTEWWHFDYKGWEKYPIEDLPFSAVK